MHADQDLAFSGLGDGKLANGASRSEGVDGEGTHQSGNLKAGVVDDATISPPSRWRKPPRARQNRPPITALTLTGIDRKTVALGVEGGA